MDNHGYQNPRSLPYLWFWNTQKNLKIKILFVTTLAKNLTCGKTQPELVQDKIFTPLNMHIDISQCIPVSTFDWRVQPLAPVGIFYDTQNIYTKLQILKSENTESQVTSGPKE